MIPRSSARWLGGTVFVALAGIAMAAVPNAFLQTRIEQWQATPAAQQHFLRERAQAWDALPQAERIDRRARYHAWRELDETTRARLRAQAQAFAALPPAEQARLRTVFATQDVMQQRGWRLGPELGADWPRLQPLFAYVPERQRVPSLRVLQQLDPAARDDLAALAQRIPPQSREAFRSELLRVPPASRAAWLHQRRTR